LPLRRFVILAGLLALAPLSAPGAISAQTASPQLFGDLRWRVIGPFRGGRTVAVSGVPQRPGTFYMAPNNGGVWKSNDYARTWQPVFDGQDTGSIGALSVAPSDPNIVYVGSGEGLRRPDLSTGDGIYKSSDAGATWTHLGLRDGQQIQSIAVDPRDPNRLYVAVVGHPFGPNEERGLYRSTDGGLTFGKVLGSGEDVGAVEVKIDPNHPDTLYAATWASRNGPWNLVQVYELYDAGGLYKSTDGGTTWTKLTNGLPAKVGRIGIAISPADSKRIYTVVEKPDGCAIFRSSDAGASWTQTNDEERVCGRTEDFAGITADPKTVDEVYAANTTTYRSTDAGKTWTGIKGAPGGDDYHTIWIDPNDPRVIILGVDQGATLSVNGGETWSSWYNQPTAQFYHVIADDRFPYRVFGGQQESGSAEVLSRGNDGAISFREFHPVGVEEYGYVAPDPLHPWLIYGGKATVYDERTGQTQDVSPTYDRKKYRFDRTNPLVWNRVDKHELYLGLNVVFATRDGGRTWREISPDLTRQSPGEPATLAKFASGDPLNGKHRGVIYSLSPSYVDKNLIWAGTDDGLVWITHDDGAHWQSLQANLPSTSIRDLVVHGDDVVVGTHGRSFWILDDIEPLREVTNALAAEPAHLFAPAVTYRVRRDTYTDTPLPPDEPVGQNPPDGAIFDYTLGADAKGPVTIAVYSAAGELVRRMSSNDTPEPIDPEIDVPTYWVRPTRLPATGAGHHRFVWDLHEAAPLALEHGYPISAIVHDTPRAPEGVFVPPGRYIVRLSVDGKTLSQSFTIVSDPRVTETAAQARDQYLLALRIADGMNRSYAQYQAAQQRKDAAAAARYARLNGSLARMLDIVDGVDAPPSAATRATVTGLLSGLTAGGQTRIDLRVEDEP